MTLKDRSYFYNYMQSNSGTGTKSNLEDLPCQLETVIADCSFDDSDISRLRLKPKTFRSLFMNGILEFSPEDCQDQCETILEKTPKKRPKSPNSRSIRRRRIECNCFCQTCLPQQTTGYVKTSYVKMCAPLDVLTTGHSPIDPIDVRV